MTKYEARKRILEEWQAWAAIEKPANPTGTEALIFFGHLQENKSHLLSFRYSGDKWQCVKGWLLNAGMIKLVATSATSGR